MASALNSIKNGSASTIRGYGGLASGLDRDTLIEGMTASTRAKIAKQQKKKQTYAWQQEAYRSISSKLVEFSKKYTSYTNQSTNLSSPSFWARSNVTAVGANSKYISVSGTSSLSDQLSIVGVKQLANNASITSSGKVSDGELNTDKINFDPESVSRLEGQALYFKYGSKTYSVSLSTGTTYDGFTYDYSTATSAQESITRALKNVTVSNGKTLADVIKVETTKKSDTDPEMARLNFISNDTAGNTIQIIGGTSEALSALGITDIESISDEDKTITDTGFSSEINRRNQNFYEMKDFKDRVSGKSMSFTYNGITKSIKFDASKTSEYSDLTGLANYIENELDKQFGSGRIKVSGESEMLKFKTMIPNTGMEDVSSVLSISSADVGVIGKTGALKVDSGESNRLNLTSSLIRSGLDSSFTGVSPDDELKLTINNVPIEGLTYGSSLNDIINKINASDAGVTVSYLKNADKFSIVSNVDGSAGKIEFGPNDNSDVLFKNYTLKTGQDAIVSVKYAGSSDTVDLIRGSNSFNIDGLDITVNGTFGYEFTSDDSGDYVKTSDNQYIKISDPSKRYKDDGVGGYVEDANGTFVLTVDNDYISTSGGIYKTINTEPVTFNAKTDADSIVAAVDSMIKDYNEIIELVNKEVTTKPNRNYEPLTDEQKSDMTEDQIKKWEDKAKAGMLFNNSDLIGLSDSMRFIFEIGSSDKTALDSFGISASSDYNDNGKLKFDEKKLRVALESKSGDLQKLFTRTANEELGDKGGVMSRLTEITDKYASTVGYTKGILIEKAGSVYAPTSILKNSLQKSMDSLDTVIDRLNKQLNTETDRYVKQFTNLETLISQMNSQSSWLSQSFGS